MRRLMLWGLLISIAALIAGCGATSGGFCDAARQINLSAGDHLTTETERAVVQHNEYGEAVCGWRAPNG